jgi:glycosyltransferase involved in cell wall biosynthesis
MRDVYISTLSQTQGATSGLMGQYRLMSKHLPNIDREREYKYIVSRNTNPMFDEFIPPESRVTLGWDNRHRFLRLFTEQILVGFKLDKMKAGAYISYNSGVCPLNIPKGVAVIQAFLGLQHYSKNQVQTIPSIYRKLLVNYSIRRADCLVANSEYVLKWFGENFNKYCHKAMVVPHSVDEDIFNSLALSVKQSEQLCELGVPKKYILFVSKIYYFKRLNIAVKAWCEAIASKKCDCDFVVLGQFAEIYGPGSKYKEHIIQMVEEYNFKSRIHFFDEVPIGIVAALYKRAVLYIQPSPSETFGKTVLEAMACGCLVAAANAAATPEVLGDTGLYFEDGDTEKLTRIIIDVVNNKLKFGNHIFRALNRSKQYSSRNEMEKLMAAVSIAERNRDYRSRRC